MASLVRYSAIAAGCLPVVISDVFSPRDLPFPARHERLWRDDHVYDLIAVLGWNDAPVVPGRGSAIFLHVARPDFSGTEGCVALAMDDLVRVLADAGPGDTLTISARF